MSKNLCIVGTGTDVGKTYVTGLLLKKLQAYGKSAAYFKAAMSGNERTSIGTLFPGDAVQVKAMSKIAQPLLTMCPYVYETAVSPHLAAKLEGNPVCIDVIQQHFYKLSHTYDYVTMEGSGGIFCPLTYGAEQLLLEDIIKMFDLGCILVADAGLGTLNAICLTIEYMRARDIAIKGIIFNRFQPGNILHEDNVKMCERINEVNIVACVKWNDTDLDIAFNVLSSFYK